MSIASLGHIIHFKRIPVSNPAHFSFPYFYALCNVCVFLTLSSQIKLARLRYATNMNCRSKIDISKEYFIISLFIYSCHLSKHCRSKLDPRQGIISDEFIFEKPKIRDSRKYCPDGKLNSISQGPSAYRSANITRSLAD